MLEQSMTRLSRDATSPFISPERALRPGRWTAAQKARILDSRVKGTELLASTLARYERVVRPS